MRACIGRQIYRLLEAARDSRNFELQSEILAIAEYWLQQAEVEGEATFSLLN